MSLTAAVLTFDFGATPTGTVPSGFQSILAGEGKPGSWSVIQAEVPPAMTILNPKAPRTSVKPALTQTVHDPTDERFPMLAYEKEEFGDFTLTTRLRIVGGNVEQMAGIAFRLQDPENFYVIRISALGQNLRFYKVSAGLRGKIIGPSLKISTNEWYELTIQCRGTEILCKLNGALVMPALQDTSFSAGRIAFWTKSDSECQFDGASITYVPTVPLSKQVLKAALEKYTRVLDLRLYTLTPEGERTAAVACKEAEDVGSAGGKAELGAIRDGDAYVGKNKGTVTVVMPVRDRNGDPVAAARVVMESFSGQTENNAIVRARPIIKFMNAMVQSSQDPFN
jgi:hypothetical protein